MTEAKASFNHPPRLTESYGMVCVSAESPRRDKVEAAPVADGDVRELADGEGFVHHEPVDFRSGPLGASNTGLRSFMESRFGKK